MNMVYMVMVVAVVAVGIVMVVLKMMMRRRRIRSRRTLRNYFLLSQNRPLKIMHNAQWSIKVTVASKGDIKVLTAITFWLTMKISIHLWYSW